jgi:hypothetical protein
MAAVERPYEERVVDVVLAEYNALRAEIVSHINVQAAVVGLGLTAIGVIVGFAAKGGGNHQALLMVPPLSLLVVLIYSAETYRSASIEIYIYHRIWPTLELNVAKLSSWERTAACKRLKWNGVWEALVIDLPALAVFLFAAIVAQVVDRNDVPLWWIASALVPFVVVFPAYVGRRIRQDSVTAINETASLGAQSPNAEPRDD